MTLIVESIEQFNNIDSLNNTDITEKALTWPMHFYKLRDNKISFIQVNVKVVLKLYYGARKQFKIVFT